MWKTWRRSQRAFGRVRIFDAERQGGKFEIGGVMFVPEDEKTDMVQPLLPLSWWLRVCRACCGCAQESRQKYQST